MCIAVAGIIDSKRYLVPLFVQIDILPRIPRRAAAAEAVGKDLVHDAVAQKCRRRIITVINGDLIGKRLNIAHLPLAAQTVLSIPVINDMVIGFDGEIIPCETRSVRGCQTDFPDAALGCLHRDIAVLLANAQHCVNGIGSTFTPDPQT